MAELMDEIDVELPADAPADDAGTVELPADGKTAIVTPEEGLEELKAKLAESNARADRESAGRLAAEGREREATTAVAAKSNEIADTNVALLTNAIETVSQGVDVQKRAYADAMTAGDYVAAADAQAEMSSLAAKKVQLETGLQSLKNQPKVQPQPILDRTEQLAAQMASQGFHRSASWVRAHPEYVNDPRLYRKMVAAHELASADGIAPDSDDYFASVEGTLGLRRDDTPLVEDAVGGALSEAATPTARRTPPAAAPVSRGVNGSGSAPRVVRLTSEELEIAAMMEMSPAEYAKNKEDIRQEELRRQGRMN